MPTPLVADAHLDLSMNALEWNRDLRWSVPEIRESERGQTDRPDRGRGTVSFGEMRRGNVALCAATLIARFVERGSEIPGWHSQEQAWAQTQGQLAWYRAMEEAGEMAPIATVEALDRHLQRWLEGGPGPIGYVLSLEGADSLVTLHHLERQYAQGLRAVGPAHYGPGVYAQGTNASGGLGERGRALLREMERLGIILDASHLCEESFWESLDVFRGSVWASHNNCRVFVPHDRQLSDEQLRALIGRGAVVGVALDAWMLVPDWDRGGSTPDGRGVTLSQVADNIDHICQLAGNALHAGIGSDLDGAFGTEQCPTDVDTIADLQKLPPLLASRGYSEADVGNICGGNLIRFLRQAWA
ncbi:MAG TPA: membrane dipeptidase [Vicinamibacterales bacterium]|nr:membrane dipeptidase [Vicinamibacterales bacterium]HPW20395.1 membrane dipeptidase [Vicinamibacterales bacterium]